MLETPVVLEYKCLNTCVYHPKYLKYQVDGLLFMCYSANFTANCSTIHNLYYSLRFISPYWHYFCIFSAYIHTIWTPCMYISWKSIRKWTGICYQCVNLCINIHTLHRKTHVCILYYWFSHDFVLFCGGCGHFLQNFEYTDHIFTTLHTKSTIFTSIYAPHLLKFMLFVFCSTYCQT